MPQASILQRSYALRHFPEVLKDAKSDGRKRLTRTEALTLAFPTGITQSNICGSLKEESARHRQRL